MALTLRELLDKQRADREAKERGIAAPEKPAASVATANIPASRPPEPEPPQAPPSLPVKRSMFSSLAGVPANVTQSQTSSFAPQITPEAQPQEKSPQMVGGPVAPTNGSGPATPGPTLTDDETENLRRNLAFLAANLDEKEVIGQVLRTTVRQIQQHPELNAIMIDSDFDLIVQAARRSMKFTARKKEDKANVKASKADKKAELDKWLKDSGIDIDGL